MASGDLIPSENDQLDSASSEVQFALVIARMIDSVRNSPADLRQAIYDLARYKLQEQFTSVDANDMKRAQQALENAIRGVEEFSEQHASVPLAPPEHGDSNAAMPAPYRSPPANRMPPVRARAHLEVDSG